MKNIWFVLLALIVLGSFGAYFFFYQNAPVEVEKPVTEEPMPVEPDGGIGDTPEDVVLEESAERPAQEVIGTSRGENDIMAYHYGSGETEVLFVGGIHGGYSVNTAALGFELIDYLDENPDVVPEGVTVTVIPVANPDGLKEVVGTVGKFDLSKVTQDDEARVAGRFNAEGVDLNRNFDCEWQAEGTWQSRSVSGGEEPFSEPEARAIRDYVESQGVDAVVVYYSQAGGVYSSNCLSGVLPETAVLTNLYADASGYPAYEEFDYYEITGDMVNWLAKKEIPAISVLLTNHEETEWNKNRLGIEAIINHFQDAQ